jgi:hypothetical protein
MLGFGLVLALAWPTHSRRTPLDPSYPANVLSMIHDSNSMEPVAKDSTGSLNSLKIVGFGIGIFTGLSGKQRLGIDVADCVTTIDKKIWRLWRSESGAYTTASRG